MRAIAPRRWTLKSRRSLRRTLMMPVDHHRRPQQQWKPPWRWTMMKIIKFTFTIFFHFADDFFFILNPR